MTRPKFPLTTIVILLSIGLFAGCSAPAALPIPSPTPPPPTLTPPDVSAGAGLLTLYKEVRVTPVGHIAGGAFSRIGYVPGRDGIVVAFKAKLSQPEYGCPVPEAYAYKEYTAEMQETGSYGAVTCKVGPDVGGFFTGDDFYYAAMGHDNAKNEDGWWLAKYDAVTWKGLVDLFFYTLPIEERNADPMIALVDGKIDVSGKFRKVDEIGPGHATHHQFFTPDLRFIDQRILTDVPHIDLTSLLAVGGVTNFITSTDLWGDMLVLQYDARWSFLGSKIIKLKASAPEGAAFDGKRFYVSYVDNSLSPRDRPGSSDNIRLAAFDSSWNLLDDVAVTTFTPADHKSPGRPSLTLHNNRIYVTYDQAENVIPGLNQSPENMDIQVYVKVYDVRQTP